MLVEFRHWSLILCLYGVNFGVHAVVDVELSSIASTVTVCGNLFVDLALLLVTADGGAKN